METIGRESYQFLETTKLGMRSIKLIFIQRKLTNIGDSYEQIAKECARLELLVDSWFMSNLGIKAGGILMF